MQCSGEWEWKERRGNVTPSGVEKERKRRREREREREKCSLKFSQSLRPRERPSDRARPTFGRKNDGKEKERAMAEGGGREGAVTFTDRLKEERLTATTR